MFDSTAAAGILKEHYPFNEVALAGHRANKFYSVVKKRTDAGGDQEKIAIDIADVQGAAHTFATAQTNASTYAASNKKAFELTLKEDYSIARISGKVIAQTAGNPQAFIRAVDSEIKSAHRTAHRRVERELFRAGDGVIGSIGTIAASVTLTLAHATQAHLFEPGMRLVCAANNASALDNSGGVMTVTGVNRSAGTLTAAGNWNTTWSGASSGFVIMVEGDYVSTSDRLAIPGLEAWVPATAPTTGDSFYGVDRSVDVERLSGVRYDASSYTIEEGLINAQSEGSANGATPRHAWMQQFNVRRLVSSLSSKARYTDVMGTDANGKAVVGFRALLIDGEEGEIAVMSNPVVPYDVAWMVDPDVAFLFSAGEFPGVLEEDGLPMMRVYNGNSYEVRIGGYPTFGLTNPGGVVRVKLA